MEAINSARFLQKLCSRNSKKEKRLFICRITQLLSLLKLRDWAFFCKINNLEKKSNSLPNDMKNDKKSCRNDEIIRAHRPSSLEHNYARHYGNGWWCILPSSYLKNQWTGNFPSITRYFFSAKKVYKTKEGPLKDHLRRFLCL